MNRFQMVAFALLVTWQLSRIALGQSQTATTQQLPLDPYSSAVPREGSQFNQAKGPSSNHPSWNEFLPTQTEAYRPGSLAGPNQAGPTNPRWSTEPDFTPAGNRRPATTLIPSAHGQSVVWPNAALLIRRLPPVEPEPPRTSGAGNPDYQASQETTDGPALSPELFTSLNAQNQDPSPPAPSGSASSSDSAAGSEPLGQAPPDLGDLFQSQSSILLKPGEMQLDIGMIYLWQDSPALVALPGNAIALQRVRDRIFLLPIGIRYGYRERVEVFANIPFGLAAFERSDPVNRITDTQGGLGDISGGFQYQLFEQKENVPNVTASLVVVAPTGSDPFSPNANIASLGNGFWEVGSALNFVRSIDPVVFFGSVGYRHQLGAHFNNVWIDPGEIFTYSYGLGFAVSDEIAVSASLNGFFQTRTSVSGALIANSSVEPVSLRLSASRRTSKCTRYQPFVDFGLNDDAVDFALGVIFTRDLRKQKVQ